MANPVYFSATNQYRLKHTLTLVKQDIANNRSYVKIVLQVEKLEGWGFWTSEQRPWNIKIDGTTVANGTKSYDFNNYSTLTLGTYEGWVNHGSNGEKTITVSGYFSGYSNMGSATTSQSHKLTTIPRAHSFSASAFVIGSGVPLNITKSATAFTTRARILYGSTALTGWKSISGAGAQYVYYTEDEANAMRSRLPTSTSGTFTIECQTMNGSTVIATSKVNARGSLGADIVPSISSISSSETNTAVSGLGLSYVAGISKIKGSASGVSAGYGSSIDSYAWMLDNLSSSETSPTFGAVSKTAITLKLTVKDKRGRSASKSISISQMAYSRPSISSFLGRRYDPADLTKVNFDLEASATSLNSKNQIRYRIRYQRIPGGTITTIRNWTQLTTNTVNLSASYLGTIPHDGDYLLFLDVEDKFTATPRTYTLKGSRRKFFEVVDGKHVNWIVDSAKVNGSEIITEANTRLYKLNLNFSNGATLITANELGVENPYLYGWIMQPIYKSGAGILYGDVQPSTDRLVLYIRTTGGALPADGNYDVFLLRIDFPS